MLNLNEDQEMILDTVRDLVNDKIKPRAQHYDNTSEFPQDNIDALAELGIMGMTVDEKYGGFGSDMLTYAIVTEEISRGCAATATTVAAVNSLSVGPIQEFGSEYLKETYLPKFTEGKLGAFALSEPQAGSDPANLRTRAELDGDEWVINGSKIYITNAIASDVFVVFARTSDEKGKGISAFVVPGDAEGMHVMEPEKKLGIRASPTSAMSFDNVRIPKENLIGEEGKGLRYALTILDSGRIAVAAQAVGIAQAALDDALDYAKEREQFGRPINKFQSIQMMLADMDTKVSASRMMYYHAARLKDSGQDYIKQAAQAKLYASEKATEVTHTAIQVHGGSGFLKDYEVERYYRDARITEIYEGTSEIMRLVIARELMKS